MINHADQINSRVYGQYKNSPKLIRWLSISGEIANELQVAIDAVMMSYDIGSSSGAQLDVIGRLVGIGREVIGEEQITVNQFGDDTAQFGDETKQFTTTSVASDEQLSDEYYRVLIRSKIAKNNSNATIDSIIQAVEFILPDGAPIVLNDTEDMAFGIDIYGTITPVEKRILESIDIIPRPQGVQFTGYRLISDLTQGLHQFGDDTAQFGDETKQFRS